MARERDLSQFMITLSSQLETLLKLESNMKEMELD